MTGLAALLAAVVAGTVAPAALPIHWSPGHHYGWAIDPYSSYNDAQGHIHFKWRCAPRKIRRFGSQAAICETFDRGKTWRMIFANHDAGNSDTHQYFNYLTGFLRTSSRDAVVSGGNGGHFELYTNTNGKQWVETEAFDPNHDTGCVQWPDYCTGITFLRITSASAPVFGGKPGGIVIRTGVPHQSDPYGWTYEPALFRIENWPVRGLNDPYPVRIF